jgi:Uma2 family endonuclease
MTITKYKLNSSQYHLMAEIGVFNHDKRLELIEGEIIKMSPLGRNHCACVANLQECFHLNLGLKVIIWTQNSIRLDDNSEPQPDFALLKRRKDFYQANLPTPSDILLIVEVADSTLNYDRNVKMPLCAKFGIPEAWLIDVNGETLTRYTDPGSEGYKSIQALDKSESVACLGIEIAIAKILVG